MKFSKLITYLNKHPFVVVGGLILFGLILRCLRLPGSVLFAYDQARDAQRIMEMVYRQDIKLVGPETDIPGVFNGVLYYLILAPVYLLSGFNPTAASFVFIFLNLAVIYMLYELALILFRNKYVGYLAGFLWAISYEQINFAKYISNASPMPVAATLFFFGLALFIFKKKDVGLILSAVGFAASIHFNFYLVYLVVFYPLFFLIYRPKVKLKPLLVSVSIIILLLAPFALAEIKWQFAMVKGLLNYFSGHAKNPGETFNLFAAFGKYYERIAEMVHFTFFSFERNIGTLLVGGLMLVGTLLAKREQRIFLLVCIFSTLPLFIFNSGVLTVQVINSSIFFAFTLTTAAGLIYLAKTKFKVLAASIFLLFLCSNVYLYYRDDFRINTMFASHPLQTRFEKQVVDFTYRTSNNKPFSICTVSNPLFFNTVWSFYYKTYGEKKYGYLPSWAGQKQFMNVNYLNDDVSHIKDRYLIIEPLVGIPDFAKKATVYLEDKRSLLLEEKEYGQFVVQKRKLYDNYSELFEDSQHLPAKEIKNIESVVNAEARYYCFIGYKL